MGSFRKNDPTQFARHFLDVLYADEDPRQVMDIWLPNEGEGPFPLIVFVRQFAICARMRPNTIWMLKTSPSWAIPQVGTLPAW